MVTEPSCGTGGFFGLLPESMRQSQLYGVEIDSISGRIAKQLYPQANIAIQGFEQTKYPKNSFDLAIGNVPFGQYSVNDPAYNRPGFPIHNYFIAKTLDLVRPGGIVAFVTSRYTMDAKTDTARKYFAGRADLLGAVRLPNNAFRASAGTDVDSDILFLQKREAPPEQLPSWVDTVQHAEGFHVNRYFIDHPEMILGEAGSKSTPYGRREYTTKPIPGADLNTLFHKAVENIHGRSVPTTAQLNPISERKDSMVHFDAWASRFGETTTALELAPEGTGYRLRTRFARFYNLPELMAMFRECADVKTAEDLNLPTPEVEYHVVESSPTERQKEIVTELGERAALVHSGAVKPTEDNMLAITTDGRKLGLDQRLIEPSLPDEPGTKVNKCVDNVFRIWQEGAADRLTQLIFCDLSTPKKGEFNVYDDIREKLVERGVPSEEIAFVHDANTDAKKKALFAKVRSGHIRILMGSTQKLGTGTNVQDRLIASHDLECPWRPRDVGRILRTFKIKTNVEVTDNGKDDF